MILENKSMVSNENKSISLNATKSDISKPEIKKAAEHGQSRKQSMLNKLLSFEVSKISEISIILAIRHLALMLRSGISLYEALDVLDEQTENKKLKTIFQDISEEVHGGINMADSMRKYPKIFKPVITSIVEIGEQAGTLEKNLVYLANYLKKQYEIEKKIKGALVYPIIILGITLVEVLGVIFFILPKVEGLMDAFENTPRITEIILTVAREFRENFLFIGGGFLIIILFLMLFSKTQRGKRVFDTLALTLPILKDINKATIYVNFARTLEILMSTGIPISHALKITAETTDNVVYKEIFKKVQESVKGGESLGESLSLYPKYFPVTFLMLIKTGEGTGTLAENLTFALDYYAGELEEMVSNLTNLMEPVLLVIVGLMVGVLALSIVVPIYQLTGSINQ